MHMKSIENRAISGAVEELNLPWVAQVMTDSFLGATLASVDLINANSGTTGRAILGLEWEQGKNSALPEKVFVKLRPTRLRGRKQVVAFGIGHSRVTVVSSGGVRNSLN